MKGRKKFLILLVVVVLGVVLGGGFWGFKMKKEEKIAKIEDRGLPILNITLGEGSLEEIKNGNKETTYSGNNLTAQENGKTVFYSDLEIRGRGNTTWSLPKKPFQLKFSKKVNLLGMNKVKKWVLLANYSDTSQIRNDVAMSLMEMLDGKEHRGKFVELYFDGEYEGLYYLLPKVEIEKEMVDLRDDLGVLVELDNLHRDEVVCYLSYEGNCLTLKNVVADKTEGAQEKAMEDFLINFNKLEVAAENGDFATVTEVADVESLVEYFLINEFAVNPDAYSSSFYWHKDGVESKLQAGPIWDFDLAFGNLKWGWASQENFYSPEESLIRRKEAFGEDGLVEDKMIAKLMYNLVEIPEFQNEVSRVFREKMAGREQELKIKILETVKKIRKAAFVNEIKWEQEEFDAEVVYLLNWIQKRFQHFEIQYGDEEGMASPKIVL